MIKYKHYFLRYLSHGVVVEVQEVGGCCCLSAGRFMSTSAAAAREVVASDDGSGNNSNNVKRRGVKMSKQERKSMVVDFVNKYRTTNAGKFPSAQYTKEQVGGSYYTVRSIIQELQYDSKLAEVAITDKTAKPKNSNKKVNGVADVTDSVDAIISSHVSGEDDISSQGEISSDHVISSEGFADGQTVSNKVKGCPNHEVREMVGVVNESSNSATDPTDRTVTEVHSDVKQVVVDGSSGRNMIVDDVSDVADPSLTAYPESLSSSRRTELEEMDIVSSPTSVSNLSTSDSMEKSEEKQSLWGNLKSFASGFINNWWKS